ncbi:MAG: hypothetical protein OQK97_10105 [Deltaproteobacteria bacterium]|nr:hypothetical protein [Deltaproteobacteria bacterium]MCW8892980.1 hypothetical protein [Deltaproteobacteria bacterium]
MTSFMANSVPQQTQETTITLAFIAETTIKGVNPAPLNLHGYEQHRRIRYDHYHKSQ